MTPSRRDTRLRGPSAASGTPSPTPRFETRPSTDNRGPRGKPYDEGNAHIAIPNPKMVLQAVTWPVHPVPYTPAALVTPTSRITWLRVRVEAAGRVEATPGPALLEKLMDLVVVVVGMGEWAKQYARALAKFLKSRFLDLNDVYLKVWFVDPKMKARWKDIWSLMYEELESSINAGLPISCDEDEPKCHLMAAEPEEGVYRPPKQTPDIVFVVTPPDHHSTIVNHYFEKRPPPFYIGVEKPFTTVPIPTWIPWTAWNGTVFLFDHYFARLFNLASYRLKGYGKIKKLIFRMIEPYRSGSLQKVGSGPTVGSLLDMGSHAVPLLMMFADPPDPLILSGATTHGGGDWTEVDNREWRLKKTQSSCLIQSSCSIDVCFGWKDPPPGEPTKYFCIECDKGRIWSDLAQPFLIFTDRKPPRPEWEERAAVIASRWSVRRPDYEDWAKYYPPWTTDLETTSFAAADPVQLMVNSVCSEVILHKQAVFQGKAESGRLSHTPCFVLPVSDTGAKSGPDAIPAETIMKVLQSWS